MNSVLCEMVNDKTINDFLFELLRKHLGISGVWFIGSRANNKDIRCNSDWDFIVHCEKQVLPRLSRDEELKARATFLKIDLLVDTCGEEISSPWKEKRILKKELRWATLSNNKAKYWGAKSRPKIAEESLFLSDWKKYAIEHGADDSMDVSDWCLATRVWLNEE